VSYLVERGSEREFRRAIEQVSREATAHLVVAGPRAPYSFAPPARRTAGT
jgi:Gas vesicle synthesis protein GvpL/GvpF